MRTNDEWLRALSGPEPSEEALFDLTQSLRRALAKVYRGSSNVADADLDDFVQEAVLKVLKNLDRFRGDSRLTSWAAAIAIRVAMTELRRRQPIPFDPHSAHGLELTEYKDPNENLERRELLNALKDAIDHSLTDYQRSVILALLAGTPIVTVAERLGKERNAIYKTYHDCRVRLKRALEKAGYSNSNLVTASRGKGGKA